MPYISNQLMTFPLPPMLFHTPSPPVAPGRGHENLPKGPHMLNLHTIYGI